MSVGQKLKLRMFWAIALPASLGVAAMAAQTPTLPEITSMPPSVPYRWKNVVIRGGGFVTGIVFSPARRDLVYVRTDVGGAYRSDNAGEQWTPLTDQFGRDDSRYLGIESIGLDPSNPDKLYLAAGMYSADWGGPAAILRSNDKGETFARTPLPFKMGGNEDGRGCGERLAVDPNLGSVLFFGSRKAGLWKSDDSAVTWTHVDSFPVPAQLTGPGENTGITFVAFDASTGTAGSATQAIYIGIAQSGIGLYRSRDAGATWELVPGAPKDLFPTHAVVDAGKTLYFSYADAPGPNGMQNGGIWKFMPQAGKWKDISPLKPGAGENGKFGFGGLTMDAQHPDTLMVTTLDRWWPGDTVFRTTNGGSKWKEINPEAMYSSSMAPWVYWHKDKPGATGWMNDIKIDPFNSAKVLYVTGGGLWGSADVTASDSGKYTHWGFPNEGLEETVPLAIVSPQQGAHLLSAVGDIGGFRHEFLDRSPKDGSFTNPQINTTTSLDFASLAPAVLVRVGDGDGKTMRGGYSEDNGMTWKPFGSEPPSSHNGGGNIALSADGKVVVWTPRKGAAFWTDDWGKTWHPCGALTQGMKVTSDRVNPRKFYSFDLDKGQLLESLDGAQNFGRRIEPVAPKGDNAVVAPMPGIEGDLWIAAGDKVLHTNDSGVTFSPLAGIVKVLAIGFGMPATGAKTPTVFLNGYISGEEGTFRSEDDGQSWVRIDDPAHQFGWKNAITGDPRVFGRLYIATGGRGIVYGDPAPSAPVVSK